MNTRRDRERRKEGRVCTHICKTCSYESNPAISRHSRTIFSRCVRPTNGIAPLLLRKHRRVCSSNGIETERSPDETTDSKASSLQNHLIACTSVYRSATRIEYFQLFVMIPCFVLKTSWYICSPFVQYPRERKFLPSVRDVYSMWFFWLYNIELCPY